ncbi:hypothetical protein OXX79_001821 [Metschnikowia pulcherrima]
MNDSTRRPAAYPIAVSAGSDQRATPRACHVASTLSTPLSKTLRVLILQFNSITTNMSSPAAPGGLRSAVKRRNVADKKTKEAEQKPLSTRAAGAGGSSATMLKLFTDEAQGLRVDPLVVLILAVGFIFSVIIMHVLAKITGKFTS